MSVDDLRKEQRRKPFLGERRVRDRRCVAAREPGFIDTLADPDTVCQTEYRVLHEILTDIADHEDGWDASVAENALREVERQAVELIDRLRSHEGAREPSATIHEHRALGKRRQPASRKEAKLMTNSGEYLPFAKCPKCGTESDYEVRGLSEMGGGGNLTVHDWTLWTDSTAVCRNHECEYVGWVEEFLPIMVEMRCDENSFMTLDKAVDDMAGAMEDDYANTRWGGIFDLDGNEIPVDITVAPSAGVDVREIAE